MERKWGAIETGRGARFRPNVARVPTAFGLSTAAVVIAIAFTALPARTPSNRAAAASDRRPFNIARNLTSRATPNAKGDASASNEPTQRFTGTVGPDLSQSLLAAGVPEPQAREYVALLARAIPLATGLSVADRFDLIVERKPDRTFGQLLYAGLDRVARADLELLKCTDGKRVVWLNAESTGTETNQSMAMPVHGRVTSPFGQRFHPILGYERFHDGVDLGAAAGTPIVAAADGRVISAGWAGGYGKAVEIAHAGGVATRYGHMSRVAAFAGEAVRRGQLIGYVGSTGLSTGPHLHFEVMKNGRPVNPLSITSIGGSSGQLDAAQLLTFHNELRAVLLSSSPRG